MQAHGFRFYFTPLAAVLFTFPSRYWFTIGLSGVFSLSGWSRQIHTGFHVPRTTQDTAINYLAYAYETITLYGASFQRLLLRLALNVAVLQPLYGRNHIGLGYCAFARHYLRNHFCFLLLRLLRCFSSAGLLTYRCNASSMHWVAPFGYLRINSYVPIPVAFRSLSRPSSPLRA